MSAFDRVLTFLFGILFGVGMYKDEKDREGLVFVIVFLMVALVVLFVQQLVTS